MRELIKAKIKEFTGKQTVVLTDSGNKAIYGALFVAKQRGYTKLFIPDQGGWLTYKKYATELGFEVVELKTKLGVIDATVLQSCLDGVLLCTSLAGYYVKQPLKEIAQCCKQQKLYFILDCNDLSDEENLEIEPNLVVSSFGKWKVVNNYHGGCIAGDSTLDVSAIVDEIEIHHLDEEKLLLNLKNAPTRLAWLREKSCEIANQLREKGVSVFNHDNRGIVVICEVSETVETYCNENELPFTRCPREIRILEDAISIEIKRLT